MKKCSSVCIGLDFINDTLKAYFNGEEVDKTEMEAARKKEGEQ